MKKIASLVVAAALGLAGLGLSTPAYADKPYDDSENKVWVCKIVSHEGSYRLKDGKNPIYVSVNALGPDVNPVLGAEFSDAQPSFLVSVDDPAACLAGLPPVEEPPYEEPTVVVITQAEPPVLTFLDCGPNNWSLYVPVDTETVFYSVDMTSTQIDVYLIPQQEWMQFAPDIQTEYHWTVEDCPVEEPPYEEPPVDTPPTEEPPVVVPPAVTPPTEVPPVTTPPIVTTSVESGETLATTGGKANTELFWLAGLALLIGALLFGLRKKLV